VSKWLRNFAYRIDVSLWMFASALVVTALIAVITTFYISWKASLMNPDESLKYE
jgi:ABC-type lipoprotein release transport system permease subunit